MKKEKEKTIKARSWLGFFTLENMVSIFSLSFIASIIFILAHNYLSAMFGEMSLISGIAFFLALIAILVNTIASLYFVWRGLIRLVRKEK